MQIYLIRHPKPLAVLGTCYGRLDAAVDADETCAAAIAVRQRLPASVLRNAPIYTSPLSRCATLARALAAPGVPIVDHDLIEMDFGSWEGRSWDTVPREQLDSWAQDLWGYRPGGGENAQAVAGRWDRFLSRLRSMNRETVVAITHAGVIRVALAQAGRRDLGELTEAPVEYGAVHALALSDCPAALARRVEDPA
jgi:alpha-ribazole phosphatase